MKHILIVKLWAHGDVLLATPLLRALKRDWPDCRITWLGDQDYADILANNPLIDEVIIFNSKTWRNAFRKVNLLKYVTISRALFQELQSKKFDIVINLVANKWWSLLFNRAPITVGLFPTRTSGLLGMAYTHAVTRPEVDLIHNSRWNLLALPPLGPMPPFDERMVLGIGEGANAAVDEFLETHQVPAQLPLLILHPGTSQDTKCWPAEQFAAVVAELSHRFAVVLTGSPGEKTLCDEIVRLAGSQTGSVTVAAGQLRGLDQTIALVARASAVVTGDTVVIHISSTFGIPTVGIYGSTRPNETVPLFGNNILLFDDTHACAPCYKAHCRFEGSEHKKCLKGVTSASVVKALNSLLTGDNSNLVGTDRQTATAPKRA